MAESNRFKILVPEPRKKKERETGCHYDLVVTGNEHRIHMRGEEKHS